MHKISPEDQAIHEEFSLCGQNAREWTRKCALLLPEVEQRQIWRLKGFGSLFEYAAKIAGMNRDSVTDALRIGRRIEQFPALKKVAEEKGLQRVRPILAMVTPETEGFWAEKARVMSKMTLQTYVKDFRSEARSRTAAEPEEVELRLTLKAALARKLGVLSKRVDFEKLLEEFVDTVESREMPAAVANNSRYRPVAIERAVLARTGGLCAYPTCTRPATSLHHVQRWSTEKVHDPARLQPVCDAHERMAHLGLIDGEEGPVAEWRVREEQDETHPKYYVDQFVQLFRNNAARASPG